MQRSTAEEALASPRPDTRWPWDWVIWVSSLIASGALLCQRQLTDFDLPWNLATGRILAQTRQIPLLDDLAYTARPLQYVEVLGDTFLYCVYAATGAAGLQVLCAGIGLGVVVLLHARTQRLGPLRWLWGALGLFALSDWFILRPALFSWLGIIATLSLLEAHRQAPDRRAGRWALAALVPLFFAWANTHGFVALGALLVSGYALYRVGARVFAQRAPRWWPAADGGAVPTTLGMVGLALLAGCVNTLGPRLLLGPFRVGERTSGITEWASPGLDYFLRQQPLLSLWFALSLSLWLGGRDRSSGTRIPNAFSMGVVLVACALTASTVRMLPIGAILMAHAATTRACVRLPARTLAGVACAICPLLAAVALFLVVPLGKPAGFDRQFLPVDAAEFVATARPQGRMYNFMPYGGYLALRLWPEYRVLTDGRDALAREPELVEAILLATRERAAFEELSRRFQFDWALVSAREGELMNPGLAGSPEWVMIYLDDIAAVYVRKGGASDSLSNGGYRRLRHLIHLGALLSDRPILDPQWRDDVAHDGALALAQAPDSPRAAFLAACGALANHDAAAFEAAYRRLAWLMPEHPALTLLSARWQEGQSSLEQPRPAP